MDITDIDLKSIEENVKKVIAYSQDIPIEKLNGVHQLIQDWYNKKQYIYWHFGDKLRIKSKEPITFEIDERTKKKNINDFCDRIENKYGLGELTDFIFEVGIDNFYNNILTRQYTFWDGRRKPIEVGSKVIKSFKYFVDDKDVLRSIQDEASMLIQENKVTGYLCASIHPLDFLSSSENTYKWRSCHALDGDYRAGNLDYISDSSTIICYLEGEENVKLPNFPADVPWNSKKWRMLLNVSRNSTLVFAGRQYPFFSHKALDEIKDKFLPKILDCPPNFLSNWHNDCQYNYNCGYNLEEPDPIMDFPWGHHYRMFFPGGIPVIDNHIIQQWGILHYNDYLESTIYEKPYYLWTRDYNPNTEIVVGQDIVKCLCCGEKRLRDASSMVCDDCYTENDTITYCNCCERRIYTIEEPFTTLWDGSPICMECAEKETIVCDRCGKRYYKSEANRNKITNKLICINCVMEEHK